MAGKKRIVFFRLAQETNALSELRTEVADFERNIYQEGEQLLRACMPDGNEAPGFAKNCELSGFVKAWLEDGERFEIVPLFSAWTIPAGPLSVECLSHYMNQLKDGLQAELDGDGIDGVFVSMHGAMCADGTDDPEGDMLEMVRNMVGDDVPIAASADLHMQLTKKKFDNCDILRAYHTNPHRDHFGTGKKAAEGLLKMLHGEVKPAKAWRTLPLVIGGGTTLDFLMPMRPIYRRIKKWERDPRVLSISITNVQLWHDDPALGWTSFVMTDNDPGLAEAIADELAEMLWETRHKQPPHFPSPEDAIAKVKKSRIRQKLGVTVFSDASDVVGAGAPGENPRIIEALLEHADGLLCYAPMRDWEVVEQLWDTPIGEWVDVDVGGKIQPDLNHSLHVRAKLLNKKHTENFDRVVVLEIDNVRLVVTEGVPLVMKPDFYTDVGLSMWKADIVVVKSFFPFHLFFAPYERRFFYIKTKGVTDWDAGLNRPFDAPVHPKDVVLDWRNTDAMRRGLSKPPLEVVDGDDTEKRKRKRGGKSAA